MNAPESQPPPNQPPARRPWMPQFGIAEMMLAVMIFCVMGAALNYLKQAEENEQGRALFVMFTLTAPIAFVLILSAYHSLKRWLKS